jgi:biopolymer transport protein ExbB
MQDLHDTWIALKVGGLIIIPLSVLAVLALAVMIEKAFLYGRYARLAGDLVRYVETYGFAWETLEQRLAALSDRHYFRQFFEVVISNRQRPLWWTESRAADEAQLIETSLARRLWVLETIVTAAPLLGLMGTIWGMMHSFHLIGDKGLVNPTGVTGGVAQALIATEFGLLIAVIALFGFNYFSRRQAQTLDEMERLGTRLIDHIRLDHEGGRREAA